MRGLFVLESGEVAGEGWRSFVLRREVKEWGGEWFSSPLLRLGEV